MIFISGFETPHTQQAILELSKMYSSPITAWIGDASVCSHNIYDLFRGAFSPPAVQLPDALLCKLEQRAYATLLCFSRHWTGPPFPEIHELHNRLHNYACLFVSLFTENNVRLALFSNLPHEGVDNIAYTVAEVLGIRTVICSQAPFPNRFFLITDLNDFGCFSTSPADSRQAGQETEISEILESFKTAPFYMSDLESSAWLACGSLSGRVVHLAQWVKRLTHSRNRLYKNRLSRLTKHRQTDGNSFIYFPLHLQPELSTCPLGGQYWDQVLAIEAIHNKLPPGWAIACKENPKQTAFMRGSSFFRRLERLKNIYFVPTNTDSHDLISKCHLVATVTGTAGIEGLVAGKPVVTFGRAWYNNFTGVTPYTDSLTLQDDVLTRPTEQSLIHEIGHLVTQTKCGVIDPAYARIVEGYTRERNNHAVAQSLQGYFRDLHAPPVQEQQACCVPRDL